MARVLFGLNAGTTQIPGPSQRTYVFTPVGQALGGADTQFADLIALDGSLAALTSTLDTDQATLVTNSGTDAGTLGVTQVGSDIGDLETIITAAADSTLPTDFALMAASLGTLTTDLATLITNAGTDATSLGVDDVATDIGALGSVIAAGSVIANTITTSVIPTADLTVSLNTTNITSVTQLRRAFDQLIGLAQGGVGGLTP